MIRYETLMLAVPEITQDESRRLESEVERVVKAGNASMIAFDRWGKCRLAFPVKKNEYGVYYLARFEMKDNPNAVLDELRTLFAVKLNDIVMRHMISYLDPKKSLEYERPLSVEEAPTRETPSFLRDKAEGSHGSYAKAAPEDDVEPLMDEDSND